MSNNKRDASKETKATMNRGASTEAPKKTPLQHTKPSAQATTVFRISGHITHPDTKKGLSGLRIEAIGKDPHYDQRLGIVEPSIEEDRE